MANNETMTTTAITRVTTKKLTYIYIHIYAGIQIDKYSLSQCHRICLVAVIYIHQLRLDYNTHDTIQPLQYNNISCLFLIDQSRKANDCKTYE